MRSSTILAGLVIVISGAVLFFAALIASSALPVQDLAQYWSAAHLVRQDPYSLQSVSAFERASGTITVSPPLVIKNPPWAILFVLPMALFSYRVSFALWTVFSVVVVAFSTRAVWRLHDSKDSIASILLPFLFGPTIVLLLLGQWTILVLLGITIFLVAAASDRDWVAGASLLLLFGKPHVALLFLLAVAFWIVQRKKWSVLVSAVAALMISCIAVFAINQHIFSQFLERTREVVGETVPYPNLGGILYLASGNHALALIPQIAGLLWLISYWHRHRHEWDWKREGMLVLLVSVTCSYYSYPYDEILVLPALIVSFLNGNRKVFVVCFVATNIGYAIYLFQIAGSFGFTYMFLSWTATAWLVTYVASMIVPRSQAESIVAAQN